MALEEQPIFSVALSNISELMENISEHMTEQEEFRDEMCASLKDQLKLNQENQKIVMEQMKVISSMQIKTDKLHFEQLKKNRSVWKEIKHDVGDTFKTIKGIGGFSLKVGSFALGLGIAGAYGFGKLASSAGNERREAMALGPGTTIGHMLAFENSLPKIMGESGRAFLQEVQSMKQKPEEWFKLRNLTALAGIGEEEHFSLPASDLIIKSLDKVKEIVDKMSPLEIESIGGKGVLQSYGLSIFEQHPELINIIRSLGKPEISEIKGIYEKNKANTNVKDKNAKSLQELSIQWQETMTEATSSLKNQLGKIAEPTKTLVGIFGDYMNDLIDGQLTTEALNLAMGGLTDIVKFLGSRDSKADVEKLFVEFKDLGKTLHNLNHPLDYMDEQMFNSGKYDPNKSVIPQKSELIAKAIESVRKFESGNNPLALSPTGPVGLMQVTGDTIAKYFPDQISKDPKSPHYFPGTDTKDWQTHRTNWLKSHQGLDVKAGEMELAKILVDGGFLDHPEKLGSLWREQYNREKNSPQADKMARDIQNEFNKSLPKLKEDDKAREQLKESISIWNAGEQIGSSLPTMMDLGNMWNYGSRNMGMASDFGKKSINNLDKSFGISDNFEYLSSGYNDAVKAGSNINWGKFKWTDESVEREKAKKMGDFIRDDKGQKGSDKVSYNFSPRDVKRIELGVKVGSRPGGDIFGQVAAMS